MKINVKNYKAKKYYSLSDINTGYEIIEMEKPEEVLIDGGMYIAFTEEDWKKLKDKLGITKSDDEVCYFDVIGEDEDMYDFEDKLKEFGVKGWFYNPDETEPRFVSEVMEDSYIIFCEEDEIVIRVFKGEYLSSCYFGVCHQPFIKEFWSIGEGYEEVEYYELECVEDETTTWIDVETYVILEPDNKEKRVRVLRREHGRSQDSYWKNEVMSIEFFNEYHGFEFGYEGEEH